MRARQRRRILWLVARGLAAAAFGAAAFWAAASLVSLASWSATAASVASVRPAGESAPVTFAYRYRGRTRFLAVRISAAELAAAARLRTGTVFAQPPLLRDAYLRALVRTQSRSHLVGTIAGQLRGVREQLRLDDDEYVELIAASVQDIPYGTPRSAFELPVQALAAGRGVCVERSVLLAALLVHEGYDAGLWTLAADSHVAAAIRGAGEGYRGSGYAFLESTARTYVGEVPDPYAAVAAWESEPRLVVFGRGKAYRADVQTALIVEERERAERLARDLAAYARYAARASAPWRERYDSEAQRHLLAASLAAQLRNTVDDRALAFATIERMQGWRRSPNGL